MLNLVYIFCALFFGWFFMPAPMWAVELRNWLFVKIPFLNSLVRVTSRF